MREKETKTRTNEQVVKEEQELGEQREKEIPEKDTYIVWIDSFYLGL